LTDIAADSSNRVSTVYESEQNKVVAGFRVTARLASQTVDRVRVEMRNTDTGGSSANLAKYISGASLWFGSTKIATMAVSDADRSTSNDTYTFNFSGINAPIAKDSIGRFYVSVDVNGSLDSNDTTNANWAVVFPDGGVSAGSPDGSSDTYNVGVANIPSSSADTSTVAWGSNVGFTFGKFSANGVKATVGISSDSPAINTVKVETNSTITNNVELLKFTVKATASDLTLRKIPIQITSTGTAAGNGTIAVSSTTVTGTGTHFLTEFAVGDIITDSSSTSKAVTAIASDTSLTVASSGLATGTGAYTQTATVASMINTIKIYKDGQFVDSLDGGAGTAVSGTIQSSGACTTTCGFEFSNLSDPYNKIAADTTSTYTVVVDLKGLTGGNYLSGNILTASFVNGDIQLPANFSIQDVNGDQLVSGSTVRVGSAIGNTQTLLTTGALVTYVSSSYTAYDPGGPTDGTVSLTFTVKAFGDTDVTMSENQGSSETVAAGNNVVSYTVDGAAATGSLITSNTATASGGIFTVSAGDTKTFTLGVKFGVSSGFVRLTINSVDGTTVSNVKTAGF
jgi:hypothetical protein